MSITASINTRILSVAAITVLCLFSRRSVGQTREFEVVQYPEAVYINEQNTFIVKTQPGARVDVYLNNVKLVSDNSNSMIREINIGLPRAGILELRREKNSVSFRAVAPDENCVLTEKGGYLYSGETPAILLAEHRHPPKHSRRWETALLLLNLFRDARPRVKSGLMISCGLKNIYAGSIDKRPEFPRQFWRHESAGGALKPVNALAARIGAIKVPDMLVIALSPLDLTRGMSALQLRMKLEWCLQSLGSESPPHVFVVSPLVNARLAEQFPGIPGSLKTSCAANNARFVSLPLPENGEELSGVMWSDAVVKFLAGHVGWK